MSTFSAYGMGPKGFLVNRPLNDYEREHHFRLDKPASDSVHYDLSLIKLNGTFVECVDKWYGMRGFLSMAGTVFAAMLVFVVAFCSYSAVTSGFPGYWLPVALAAGGVVVPTREGLHNATRRVV